MPDLAIEVQSPDDSIKAMREKAIYYLANGAQLVWLIYPRKRFIEVYYANGEIDIFREGETLSGEALLPGFTLPVTIFSPIPLPINPLSLTPPPSPAVRDLPETFAAQRARPVGCYPRSPRPTMPR